MALQALQARVDGKDGCLSVRLHLVQPLGFGKGGGGARCIVRRLQRLGEARVRLGGRGVDSNRVPELRQRRVEVTALLEDRAEHVTGLGVLRAARERLAEQLHGLFGAARLPEHHAEGVRRFGQPGIETDRGPQRTLRLIEVVFLLEREAQVVECLGIRRVQPGELAVLGGRGLEIALLHQNGAQVETSGRVIRMPIDHGAQRGHRCVRVAFLHQGKAEIRAGVRQRRIDLECAPELGDGAVEIA